jgi:hypothetical protein
MRVETVIGIGAAGALLALVLLAILEGFSSER